MIERYSRPEMRAIWTEQNKFDAYLEVEILAADAWRELGVVPAEDIVKLREKATFSIPRIKEIEEQTRHDIVAFTRAVSESLGEERKWIHYGLTSTDVVDTANGYLLRQANDILRDDLDRFAAMLREQARKYKYTPVSDARTESMPTLPRSASSGCSGTRRCSATSSASARPRAAWRSARSAAPSAISPTSPRLCRTMYERNSA